PLAAALFVVAAALDCTRVLPMASALTVPPRARSSFTIDPNAALSASNTVVTVTGTVVCPATGSFKVEVLVEQTVTIGFSRVGEADAIAPDLPCDVRLTFCRDEHARRVRSHRALCVPTLNRGIGDAWFPRGDRGAAGLTP